MKGQKYKIVIYNVAGKFILLPIYLSKKQLYVRQSV